MGREIILIHRIVWLSDIISGSEDLLPFVYYINLTHEHIARNRWGFWIISSDQDPRPDTYRRLNIYAQAMPSKLGEVY